jgi:hypothetical protein
MIRERPGQHDAGHPPPETMRKERHMNRLPLLLLLGTTTALACDPVDLTEPPSGFGAADDAFVELDRNPVVPLHLGALVVDLEKTTLADVQHAAGVGEVHHHGDAAESMDWLCYSLPATNDRVWLTSSEMGGGTVIDGVLAERFADGLPALAACPALPEALASLRFGDGFALGATPEQAQRTFGKPRPAGDNWHYIYSGTVDGQFELSGEASVHFTDGRVGGVRLGQTTSN